MSKFKILVINPGSTSTKVGVFINDKAIFLKTISHPVNELSQFKTITDQFNYRKNAIISELEKGKIDIKLIKAIIGRGGIVKPIESGIYEINENLLRDLKDPVLGEHASNLGGLLAKDFTNIIPNTRAFIADPVVVDELIDEARISGHPEFKRISIFHALNHKAIARRYALTIKKEYNNLNLIVAHMGGGISVGAHKNGRVIDVNQALDGEGPFSPERSGTLPVGDIIDYCFSGKKDKQEIRKMVNGAGGFVAYLGTNNGYEVERLVQQGDEKATLILKAMAYQIAKEIGSMACVLSGKVDAIILTGGLAYNKMLIEWIKEKILFLSDIIVYPGGDEMNALAVNAYMVLSGEIVPKVYI